VEPSARISGQRSYAAVIEHHGRCTVPHSSPAVHPSMETHDPSTSCTTTECWVDVLVRPWLSVTTSDTTTALEHGTTKLTDELVDVCGTPPTVQDQA
jgi:hypothetical protein